jgi:hypothetical protein
MVKNKITNLRDLNNHFKFISFDFNADYLNDIS